MAKKTVYKLMPWVGRDVHYLAFGTPGGEFPAGVRRAAKITQIHEEGNPESDVGLCVTNPNGHYFNDRVKFGTEPGCWCWPIYLNEVAVEIEDEA